jgi:hypothetical protein
MNDSPRTRRRVVEAPARRMKPELRAVRAILEPDEEGEQLAFLRLEADVAIDVGVEAVFTSAGVGGIEADISPVELDEILVEEWRMLRHGLMAAGVSSTQLPVAHDRDWIEWRT